MKPPVVMSPYFASREKSAREFWAIYAGNLNTGCDVLTTLPAAELLRQHASITTLTAREGALRSSVERTITQHHLNKCDYRTASRAQ
jgi:hypothetical protein